VIGKVISIRDFFITLFFVALAMQIPVPNLDVLTVALLVGVAVVLVRVFGIFGVLYAMRGGHRTSLLTMINLSQMSEFSLVILSLGVSFGHIERDVLTNAIWAFSILAVASTYLVAYSHGLQQGISRVLTTIGLKDLAQTQVDEAQTESPPVVLLGFFRVASALVDTVRQQNEALLAKIQVVDFNPQVATRLRDLGVNAIYGDVSHPDTLHHAGIHHARAIVCTVPDSVLKGTTNSNLLEVLKRMCPDGDIIVTAESPEQARVLYEAGAAYVIQVNQLAGHEVAEAIESSLRGALAGSRDDALLRLQTSTDLI